MGNDDRWNDAAIRERFVALATAPQSVTRFATGRPSALALGYACDEIDGLPPEATESFAGVGNPLSLGDVRPGARVVDFGCGAGLDALLAGRRVGPSGDVVGIDMIPELIAKASANATTLALDRVRFVLGDLARVPVDSNAADLVVSNGAFNLCRDKAAVAAEMRRVLKPGGKLFLADMLLEEHVTKEELATLGTWSDWVAGAQRERSLLRILTEAGFDDALFVEWTGYRTSSATQGGLVRATAGGAR